MQAERERDDDPCRAFAAPVPKSAGMALGHATLEEHTAQGAHEDSGAPASMAKANSSAAAAGHPEQDMPTPANRYRNSVDAALQGVMLEPPILQMEGVPGWRRIDPEQYAQEVLRRGKQPDGVVLKLLLRNTEISLSNRGAASGSYTASVRSMLLGMTNGYGQPKISAATQKMPGVTACINKYLEGCKARGTIPGCFTWTSLQLNRFRADVHCDTGNEAGSASVAVAFGDYEGGALCIWPRGSQVADAVNGRARMVVAADINDKPLTFDPFAPHAPARWAGDRQHRLLYGSGQPASGASGVGDAARAGVHNASGFPRYGSTSNAQQSTG